MVLGKPKIVTEINYKEKFSWSFRSLGSDSLDKRGDSRSFPPVGDNSIKNGYLSNRCVFDNQDLIPLVHKKLKFLPINGFKH